MLVLINGIKPSPGFSPNPVYYIPEMGSWWVIHCSEYGGFMICEEMR